MSPSENDLRAALRDGEDDDRPDVDGLIAHVRGRRAQRRTRVLSVAAAVVVVAAAATGGAALWGGSDGHGPQGAGGLSGRSDAPSAEVRSPAGPAGTPSASCPATAGRLIPPASLEPRSAVERLMFTAPVATVTVCSYTAIGTAGGRPRQTTFTGADATALAASIEAASPTPLKIPCPDIATAEKTQLAIIGVTAGGTQLPTVITDVSVPNCNRPISNGTAVRYAWKPPAAVADRIAALTGRAPPAGRTGAKIGTPVR